MEHNADTLVWDGMPFKTLAVSMAGVRGRNYGDQIRVSSTDREWIDCSCLLALAYGFTVDDLVFQEGMDPAIVGCSGMGITSLALVQVAMVNDLHFWGLRAIRAEVPHVQPPNGDAIRIPEDVKRSTDLAKRSQEDPGSDDEIDLQALAT